MLGICQNAEVRTAAASSRAGLALVMAVLLGACASTRGPEGERVRFEDAAAESSALFLRGRMLELDGKLLEAAAAYEAAAALDPESAELFQHTAQVWARMGQNLLPGPA